MAKSLILATRKSPLALAQEATPPPAPPPPPTPAPPIPAPPHPSLPLLLNSLPLRGCPQTPDRTRARRQISRPSLRRGPGQAAFAVTVRLRRRPQSWWSR